VLWLGKLELQQGTSRWLKQPPPAQAMHKSDMSSTQCTNGKVQQAITTITTPITTGGMTAPFESKST